jgi:hypothetical protein
VHGFIKIMNDPVFYFRQAKFATVITCLLAVLFWIFFDVSKHDPALAQANVFAEDPYDAVGSFGIQLAMLSALISFVRIVRPYPKGIAVGHLTLILRGNAVALLSIVVTLTADMIAMLRYLSEWTGSTAGWQLALAAAGLMALTAWAGWLVIRLGQSLKLPEGERAWGKSIAVCLAGFLVLAVYPEAWRQRVPGPILTALVGMVLLFVLSSAIAQLIFPQYDRPYEDVLDDFSALYQWLQAHAHFARGLFMWIERFAAIWWVRAVANWLNPRKHTWNLAILAALGMGVALVLAEAIGEGAPDRSRILLVLTVFIGIEGAGVLLGYILFRQYLGIVQS